MSLVLVLVEVRRGGGTLGTSVPRGRNCGAVLTESGGRIARESVVVAGSSIVLLGWLRAGRCARGRGKLV